MQTGTVVTWSDPKGWGFIKPDEGGSDFFVHYSNLISPDEYKSLSKGWRVQFAVEQGPNGKPQAVRVTILSKAVA
jgi:cold shock CspA family protein